MKKAMQTIILTFNQVFPKLPFVLLIAASMIFLFFIRIRKASPASTASGFDHKKKNQEESLFLIYSCCILVLFFLPPVERIIGQLMRDGLVYWRFLWLFPYAFLIADAAVRLTELFSHILPKLLCGIAVIATILFAGRLVYNPEVFQPASNREKFPDIVPETVSVLHQNASSTQNPYIKLMAPLDILNKTRQYDATFYNATERVFFPVNDDPTQPWDDIVRTFSGQQDYDPDIIPEGLKWLQANYALMPDSYGAAPSMTAAGWQLIYDRNGWQIWYEPDVIRSV